MDIDGYLFGKERKKCRFFFLAIWRLGRTITIQSLHYVSRIKCLENNENIPTNRADNMLSLNLSKGYHPSIQIDIVIHPIILGSSLFYLASLSKETLL